MKTNKEQTKETVACTLDVERGIISSTVAFQIYGLHFNAFLN